jgi:hypothetical protein
LRLTDKVQGNISLLEVQKILASTKQMLRKL